MVKKTQTNKSERMYSYDKIFEAIDKRGVSEYAICKYCEVSPSLLRRMKQGKNIDNYNLQYLKGILGLKYDGMGECIDENFKKRVEEHKVTNIEILKQKSKNNK